MIDQLKVEECLLHPDDPIILVQVVAYYQGTLHNDRYTIPVRMSWLLQHWIAWLIGRALVKENN